MPVKWTSARQVPSNSPRSVGGASDDRVRVRRVVPSQVTPSLAGHVGSVAPDAAPSGPSRNSRGRTVPTHATQRADVRRSGHEHAEARLPIAVVRPGVACAAVSLLAFSSAVTNEATAALPAGEVSWACWVLSLARYAFRVAAALDGDSLSSGSRVVMTPELMLLMIVQSAADGLVEELAAVEAADVTAVGVETGVEVVAVGVELDELQPAMRAPLAARTASTVSEGRLGIAGTSMGVDHEQNRHRAEQRGGPPARGRVRRVVPSQVIPSLAGRPDLPHQISRSSPIAAPSGALQQQEGTGRRRRLAR